MLDKAKNTGAEALYLRNINVRWGSIEVEDLKQTKFREEELEKFSIQDGDLLVCEGGEPGRCAVWESGPTELKFQKALLRLRSKGGNSPRFLYHYIRFLSESHQLDQHFTGTTIKHLPQRALAQIAIHVPPIKQQQKIVASIEEAFAQISTLSTAAKSARERLDKLDRAILSKAFRGELVPQDPNDEPASELLKRLQKESA
jgi:type I restriction enzyme S subunit